MNWPWQKVERKENPVGSAIAAYFVGQPVWSERRFDKLADEAYVRNAVGYRCVKMIASSAASVSWLLKDRAGKDIAVNPVLDLLSRPAPMIGGHALFEAFFAYLLLEGNTYLVAPQLGAGRPPKELWNLRPDRMKVIPGPFGVPAGFEYDAGGQKVTFDADPRTGMSEVLHFKEFHPLNDWYGLSPVEPAAYGVDRHNAASAHNKALLDQGARPSGVLVFRPIKMADGTMQSAPQAVIEAAEKDLRNEYGGPRNAGKPMVFGGNVDWEEMGLSPKDMDFGAGKEDAARDICTAFGVPHILIVPGQSTYNNVREAKLELWEDTILPLLDKTTDALNAWLTPQFGEGMALSPDLDSISALEPRREAKRTSVLALYDKGLIDDAEAREALQWGPRSPDAVRLGTGDAQTLVALIEGATKDPSMVKPLFRFLQSVGLVEPGDTFDDFNAAWSAEQVNQADLIAALSGPKPADPNAPPVTPALPAPAK